MENLTEAIAAPALSTAQDEAETFAKVEGMTVEVLKEKRQHLGPKYTERNLSYDETVDILKEYYSLEKLAKFLNQRKLGSDELKYQSIALQFPDELVCDSTIVSQILQNTLNTWNQEFHDLKHAEGDSDEEAPDNKREGEVDFTTKLKTAVTMNRDIESVEKTIDKKTCGGNCGAKCKNKEKFFQQIWILADTSYSPCCIDEVAAGHVNADIVVHFGDACLNPVNKIQACYVFGRPYINVKALIETFKRTYENSSEKIVLMADTPYSHILPELYNEMKGKYENLAIAHVNYSRAGKNSAFIDGYERANSDKDQINTVNRILCGFDQVDIDDYLENIDEEEENFEESSKFDAFTQEYSLFHITRPHDARILQLSTKFGDLKIVDPKKEEIVYDQFPTMMKRYRNMQVARSASTIGVLVNTLSLENTRELLNQVTKSIAEAGKKHYMFVVGKPNVAKLANFDCIDVWCILGCGQSGIVIDMFGDYFKPIITPYELKLALLPQVTWTGKWVTDFDAMIEGKVKDKDSNIMEEPVEHAKVKDDDENDDYAPEFDPVTGKLKMSQPLRQLRHLELELEIESEKNDHKQLSDESSLVKKFSGTLSVGKTISTSALGLQGRQWTGLGSDFNNEEISQEGALVEEGRSGIARGYSGV